MDNSPKMKTMLAVDQVFPDEHLIWFWADDEIAGIFAEYGNLMFPDSGNHYQLKVDPRYDFGEVHRYLLTFQHELKKDKPEPQSDTVSPAYPATESWQALNAQLALLRERLCADNVDKLARGMAEEAFLVVHGDYGRRFEDISQKVQDTYALICRTAVLSFLRQLWRNDLYPETKETVHETKSSDDPPWR